MKRLSLGLAVSFFVSLSVVCLFLANSAEASGEKIILVSHGGVGNPFWAVVFNGAKQAAKDLGANVQILVPNVDSDQPGTTQKLSEAISTNPQGIAVTLATSGHCDYIKEARKKNIPLVILNARAVDSTAACPYQAYIGMDEYLAGKVSAENALASGRVRGRALVGLNEAGHAGLQARARGISDVLKKKNVKVDVMDIGVDPAAVPARLKGYFERNKTDLSTMFFPSPNGMHAVLRMMQQDKEGLGKKYAAAFDLTPLIIHGIGEGYIDHTIDQQPYLQGYYSVAQLVLAIRGGFSPVDMNTGVGVVNKANAKTVEELVKKQIR